MTGTGLPGMAVTMPNAIQFEVHVGWPVKFAELERAIADSDIAGVNSVVLRGRESGARLVAYAKGVKADLVVAGTRSPATSQSVSRVV